MTRSFDRNLPQAGHSQAALAAQLREGGGEGFGISEAPLLCGQQLSLV